MTRLLGTSLLITLALLWITASAYVWRVHQLGESADAARQQARHLLALEPYSPEIEPLLLYSLSQRPLYAPTWMDYAEWLHRNAQPEAASRAIALARMLWPERAPLLWRAALLQLELGDQSAAAASLLHHWRLQPSDGLRALALLRRLYPHTQDLVLAVAAVWDAGPHPPMSYQRQLLELARRSGDVGLAMALWDQLRPEEQTQPEILFRLLSLLLAQHAYTTAATVWQTGMDTEPGLYNGSFEQPLLNRGLGWHYREGEGYRIRRVSDLVYAGHYSLLVEFTSTENVDLRWPTQTILVTPGQSYRLQGYWSAYGITTRSGVFIELFTQGGQQRVRAALEPRWGSWSWQPFSLDLEVPDDVHQLVIRLRRMPTQALDRRIAGKLWLDALQLEPLSP